MYTLPPPLPRHSQLSDLAFFLSKICQGAMLLSNSKMARFEPCTFGNRNGHSASLPQLLLILGNNLLTDCRWSVLKKVSCLLSSSSSSSSFEDISIVDDDRTGQQQIIFRLSITELQKSERKKPIDLKVSRCAKIRTY